MTRPLVVQKYGGVCLSTPEKIRDVAGQIARRHQMGEAMIVVVSAMGKTTDDLIRLAYQVSPLPNRREMDMLLSTGERVSMALMSMALADLGCPAISFTGSQAGVLTDDSHSSAKIIDIKPARVEAELTRGRVVVLAGFQGVNPKTKEITTLGRGGSDTTAVALAAHFGSAPCEIIKEVDGVCTADPRLAPDSQTLSEVDYNSLAEMCFWGAKVLHYRSVELAKAMSVPLSVQLYGHPGRGTRVVKETSMYEERKVLSVNSHKDVHHLEVAAPGLSEGFVELEKVLNQHQLAWPQVLASAFDGGHCRLMYTSDSEHLQALAQVIQHTEGLRVHRPPLSSVSLTCQGSVASGLPAEALARLHRAGIRAEKMLLSPLSLTVLVSPDQRESAIAALLP